MPETLERKLDLTEIRNALDQPAHAHLTGPEIPPCRMARPSRETLTGIVENLRALIFPGFVGDGADLTIETLGPYIDSLLREARRALRVQVLRELCFSCEKVDKQCMERAAETADRFLQRLPEVQRRLAGDVEATYLGDPAARSHAEVILTYPGILALTYYRLAHELYDLGFPLLARMITEEAHSRTGIDIHPRATLGRNLMIDHGTGIVIGATAIIGDNVRLYQGVTLGAKSFPLDDHGNPIKGIDRHPIIEDDVTIYSGATILGRVTIGRGSVIGGNVWLTRSISPGSRITQATVRDERFGDGGGI